VLEVSLGEVSFPVHGTERPAWLSKVLGAVSKRLRRLDPVRDLEALCEALLTASLSPDPEQRERYRRACEALEGPPFGFGELALLRTLSGISVGFGPSLLRARQFGPAACHALQLVEAVHLQMPDVLIVEGPGAGHPDPQAVCDWLVARTQGEDATLEQVVMVPGGAG